MKKIFLLAILTVIMVACSDDDSKKEEKYYIDTITVIKGATTQAVHFNYNDKHQIIKMTSGNGFFVDISYEGNHFKTMTGTNYNYSFTYENDMLITLKSNQQEFPVTYDSTLKKYTFGNIEATLNEYGDILKTAGDWEVMDMTYDTSKKGPAYSLDTKDTFLFGLLLSLRDLLTSKPITKDTTSEVINTYDANGYVVKSVFADAENSLYDNITFSYIKL